MSEFMGNDRSYEYFQKALSDWIDQKRNCNEAPQKILAIETKSHEGTISKLLNPKREKPISFEKQVALANACGYDYLDFLQLGKELIEGPAEKLVPTKDKVEKADPVVSMHQDLVRKFKDPEKAKAMNEHMLMIESADSVEYGRLVGRIETKAEELKAKKRDKGPGKSRTA